MRSLRIKAWFLLAAASSLPLIAIASAGLPSLRSLLEDRALQLLQLKAGTVTREIQNILDRAREDALLLSRTLEVREFLSAGGGARRTDELRAQVEAAMVVFSTRRPIYDQVRILDNAGVEVARVDRENGLSLPVAAEALQDKSDRYYFLECRGLPDGAVYVSPMDWNVEHGRTEHPPRAMVRYCTGVYAGEPRRLGLAILNLYGERLLAKLDATDLPGAAVELLDSSGHRIARRHADGRLAVEIESSRRPGETRASATTPGPDDRAGARWSVDGDEVLVRVPIRSATDRSRPDWWVLVCASRAVIFEPASRAVLHGMLVLAASLLLAVCLTAWISRRVVRPLSELSAASRRLARGDYGVSVHASTGDEIEALATDFRDMASALRAHQERLLALQEQVLSGERFAVLGQFAAEVAHEVGNPLAAIKATVQAIQDQAAARREDDPRLERIVGEINRLSGILRGLLDTARPRPATGEPVDAVKAVAEVVDLVAAQAERRGIRLRVASGGSTVPSGAAAASGPDPEWVIAGPHHVQQILFNLLSNAIQATPPGGEVRVEVARGSPGAGAEGPPASSGRRADRVYVTVADGGPGITVQDRERIFAPYFTTKPQGTGLGLAVASALARENGGTLVAACPSGGGATFTLELPAAPDARAARGHAPAAGREGALAAGGGPCGPAAGRVPVDGDATTGAPPPLPEASGS
jgi:signal transduction histidine kinase